MQKDFGAEEMEADARKEAQVSITNHTYTHTITYVRADVAICRRRSKSMNMRSRASILMTPEPTFKVSSTTTAAYTNPQESLQSQPLSLTLKSNASLNCCLP